MNKQNTGNDTITEHCVLMDIVVEIIADYVEAYSKYPELLINESVRSSFANLSLLLRKVRLWKINMAMQENRLSFWEKLRTAEEVLCKVIPEQNRLQDDAKENYYKADILAIAESDQNGLYDPADKAIRNRLMTYLGAAVTESGGWGADSAEKPETLWYRLSRYDVPEGTSISNAKTDYTVLIDECVVWLSHYYHLDKTAYSIQE